VAEGEAYWEKKKAEQRRQAELDALLPLPTLEDLPNHGITHISVQCGQWPYRCFHEAEISIADLDLRMTIKDLKERLLCTRCGTIGGNAMPRWRTYKW
jgi:hypothetical protein